MFSLQNIPFYIFSESYGGKMAAAISLELTEVHEKSWVFTGFQVRMRNVHEGWLVEVNLSALHQQLVRWRKSWLCFFRLCYPGRSTREGQVQLCWCSARRLLDFPSRSVSHWVHIHTVSLPLTEWGGVCPHSPNPHWLFPVEDSVLTWAPYLYTTVRSKQPVGYHTVWWLMLTVTCAAVAAGWGRPGRRQPCSRRGEESRGAAGVWQGHCAVVCDRDGGGAGQCGC